MDLPRHALDQPGSAGEPLRAEHRSNPVAAVAGLDGDQMACGPPDEQDVNTLLGELPSIRATRLAYNYGTISQAIAVATPLKNSNGGFVTAICVALNREMKSQITDVDEHLTHHREE